MASSIVIAQLCCLITFLTFHHFVICRSASSDREILCIASESQALLRLKHNLTDPSNRLSSWNIASNPNCCQWAGIVCSYFTGHIIELHLNNPLPDLNDIVLIYENEAVEAYEAYWRSLLGGELNPSLIDLKHLNYLDLSVNDFGGMPIPSFLGAMTSLTYLNLSSAGFSGKIPHQIGNLSNLLYLGLNENSFSGEIPYQIGNLTNLLHLEIGSNDRTIFAKNLHWLSSLSSLQYLGLSSMSNPKSFDWLRTMQALPSLMELQISDFILPHSNQPPVLNFSSLLTLGLSETDSLSVSLVPKWIFGLTKLVSLQLSNNDFQGPIPDGIQNLTLLENLDLSENSFSSSIPHWLYNLHHLKFLNLQNNNLNGTFSNAVGNLTSLVRLQLSNNLLEGMIPTSLSNLCNLQEIDLSGLKLNQRVDEILEILTPCISHGLKSLMIVSSHLTGNLTNHIGVFENIVTLNFADNSICGALPRSFGELSSLKYLDLSQNKFNGNPFEVVRRLSRLSVLSIDENLFQGVVNEDHFSNLTNLKKFSASGNNLTLKVGPNWIPNFQVIGLDLSSWQLGQNFPSWIQSQKALHSLKISNVGISNSIPTWFWEEFFGRLSFLNLSHNHIHGELAKTLKNPISINVLDLRSNGLSGQLPKLSADVTWLDLSNNLFSGSVAELICKTNDETRWLEFLNLASNNLSGEIPDCWLKMPNLIDVNLQSNRFVGNLPPTMGSLDLLESLKIRSNMLSGKFPSILKNTSKLISLDLGENKLTGNIPAWIGEKLPNLKILCLQSNNFVGSIPSQLCSLSFLQVVDLAQNILSSNIPNCFNHLNAMMFKNKSTESMINLYNYQLNDSFGGDTLSMRLWLKGREYEYGSILGLVTIVDLSGNKFSGDIPREITSLDGLHHLNLSHNQLSGHIPPSIGNMRSLESIDFSRNQLSGEIPPTISNLSFLSMMNLSYNHFVGKIPTGTQLQTFEASSFVGNNLCGLPLPINCSTKGQIPNDDHEGKKSEGHGVNWFFVSMAFGFVVGFWAVVAPLFIYRSWRHAYFRFLDQMWLKLQSFW